MSGSGVRVPYAPPKILGSKVPENFYLLPLHSSLFTKNAPENFEVIGNSEELKSESYIGSDSSQVSPPTKRSKLSRKVRFRLFYNFRTRRCITSAYIDKQSAVW